MICLLIMSCVPEQSNGVNDACRRTFLREWPGTAYRFVVGGPAFESDELEVKAPDDYGSLQLKQRAAYEWVVDAATHVFVSFTDTYIHIPRLLTCGYEEYDYMGLKVKHGGNHFSGGAGYFLSRRALRAILERPNLPDKQGDEADWQHIADDGNMLSKEDDRFGATITRHLSKNTGNYDPNDMYRCHQEVTWL